MLAIAGGNLRAPLPVATGGDEIARMAAALTVFRDTAVEVEEQNLREIARARQRLIDAIESISEGFAFFDENDRLELCNTRYREFVHDHEGRLVRIGMTLPEIARATAAEGVIETEGLDVDAYVDRRVREHRSPGPPTLRRLGDGRWLQISERRIDGGGTVALYSDITEVKEREAELADLVEQLGLARVEAERANEAKSSFLANVSHELRTPLTSILGFARIIEGRLTERIIPAIRTVEPRTLRAIDQVKQNLEIILAEGRRLTALINNVLDLEKIESGSMVWETTPLSVGDIIERSHAATASLFTEKGLAFERDVAPDLPQIRGDRDKLVQTVINLFSNAVKFTDQGSITCRVRACPPEIVVSVSDTGIGIAPEDQPKVFEKFRQVGDTLTDKPKGTGLGLPIAKQIVERHGGRIWVESIPGQGSTFSFSLPIDQPPAAAPDEDALRVQTRSRQAILAGLRGAAPRRQRSKTILVADDDASIRHLLRHDLEAGGYRVVEARDGEDAVALTAARLPDLLILDVLMPNGGGFETTTRLRADPRTMGMPILMLTVVEERERALRLGVDRYQPKPIDKDLLLAEVAALLEMGTSRRRVLVADPDAGQRQSLVDALQAAGHEALDAADAGTCHARLHATPRVDLVMADASLAHDADLVRLMRTEPALGDLALILLS